jgi:sulfur carrier protein ThiS
MHVTVLLGGFLRHEGGDGSQEQSVILPAESRVLDILAHLGLAPERVKLILVNGLGGTLETALREGDRVGLFPPELSFNTFVSMGFRKESVESRNRD